MDKQHLLKSLPAVGKLLHEPVIKEILADTPHSLVVSALSAVIAQLREELRAQADSARPSKLTVPDKPLRAAEDVQQGVSVEEIARKTRAWLEWRFRANLRPVLNLTGTIIHTNLGRAPLSTRAQKAVIAVAQGYSNLEMDIASGNRGSRHDHIESLLCELTGAQAGMAVNNNAAAVLLVLTTIASGGAGIVSRGQLVEIGGSFRIPDIMAQSGVKLVEVGTTNKTHLADYVRAVTQETKVILRVHTSNYKIVGFTQQPDLLELVQVAHEHGLPVFEDLGSGALFDYSLHGVGDEPTVRASIKAGVDILSFSGDKLLGGPQAGLIVGNKDLILRMKRHPLARALRLDKMTLAALEATLVDHLDDSLAQKQIPVVHMVTESYDDVARRANRLAKEISTHPSLGRVLAVNTEDGVSTIGGGSFPGETIPTRVLVVKAKPAAVGEMPPELLARQLRTIPSVPIVSRIQRDCVIWDVRTLLPDEKDTFMKSLFEWQMSLA